MLNREKIINQIQHDEDFYDDKAAEILHCGTAKEIERLVKAFIKHTQNTAVKSKGA